MLTIIGVCLFLLVALLATTVYAESLDEESRYEEKPEIARSTDDGRLPGDDVPATERCYLTEDEVQEDFEASLPLDMGQLLSIPFVIIGIVCMFGYKRKQVK